METNILSMLKDLFSENLLTKISDYLGENKTDVTAAVDTGLPAVLLGLMKKGSEPQGSASLLDSIKEGGHDGSILNNFGSLLEGGSTTTDLISSGKNTFSSLFGDKAGGIIDFISSKSGIDKAASSSLLGLIAPAVLGLLGKTLKTQDRMDPAGLTNLLLGQKEFIKSALPAGSTQLMGLEDLDSLGPQEVQPAQPEPPVQPVQPEQPVKPIQPEEPVEPVQPEEPVEPVQPERPVHPDRPVPPPEKKSIWPWLALIILAVLALFAWRSCSNDEVAPKVAETAKPVATDATKI